MLVLPYYVGKLPNHTRCLRKKYGVHVADYLYIKNGNTQEWNIFRHDKYNFCLVVCKILTKYVKRNESYELKKNCGSTGFRLSNENCIHKRFYHPSPFSPIIPFTVITLQALPFEASESDRSPSLTSNEAQESLPQMKLRRAVYHSSSIGNTILYILKKLS